MARRVLFCCHWEQLHGHRRNLAVVARRRATGRCDTGRAVPGHAVAAAQRAKERALSPQAHDKLRDILARYDVTNISARDFSELIAELKQSGAITDADQEELALVRLELDRSGVDPDELIDLQQFLEKKLQSQERDLQRQEEKQGVPLDRAAALQSTLRQLDWISKFALIHRTGDYQPLNTVA